MRAVDLYSGVGGWSLGLRLAGVEVVGSYEFWGLANETNFKNNHHPTQTIDIRNLTFEDLPHDIDIVVGSPPCTQFSYANRGGGGDLQDGLRDIQKFLEIVDFLKPKFWVMENVPRVAAILEAEFQKGGKLWKFRHLECETQVFDLSTFGVPQKRKRCFAGNINFSLLKRYSSTAPTLLLSDVIEALSKNTIKDPVFGLEMPRSELFDHIEEDFLSPEEVRVNRANKTCHTVYNSMPFPDATNRPVRTITATCTRVSRESVIIENAPNSKKYRRLTVRERASLQGFPITYQFYGKNYSQKLKMIGNALPPAFSYLIANAIFGIDPDSVRPLAGFSEELSTPRPLPTHTPPDRLAKKYPDSRSFRFAIPHLHFKSGVRFELSNKPVTEELGWCVRFFYGTSKQILEVELDSNLLSNVLESLPGAAAKDIQGLLEDFEQYCVKADFENMQRVWSHKGPGSLRPFMLLDKLDETATKLSKLLAKYDTDCPKVVREIMSAVGVASKHPLFGTSKLEKEAARTISGFILGSLTNRYLPKEKTRMKDSVRYSSEMNS